VQTTLEIINCEPVRGDWILAMDGEPCPIFATDENKMLGILGIGLFFVYAIVPFTYITLQLWCKAKSGNLTDQLTKSYSFRIFVGWAIKPYKRRFFLWEPLNASFKVAMVSATVLLYPNNRVIVHLLVVLFSLTLHTFAKPFKDPKGNIIVVMFCICDVVGIIADIVDHYSPQTPKVALQVVYIASLFLTLLYTSLALVKGLIPKMHAMREKQKAMIGSTTYTLAFVLPDWAKPGEILIIPNPKGGAQLRILCPADKGPGDKMEIEAEYDSKHAKEDQSKIDAENKDNANVVVMTKGG